MITMAYSVNGKYKKGKNVVERLHISQKNRIFASEIDKLCPYRRNMTCNSIQKTHGTMKTIEINLHGKALQWDELSPEQQRLIDIAKEQTQKAYCPYSHFHVGAAAELGNGAVVRGCNQENAAYPSGLCAERTALFAAGAEYPDEPVKRLAIACFHEGAFLPDAGSPCGACRQVMVETEKRGKQPMEVLLYGTNETLIFRSAADLLPLVFDSI